MVPIWLGGADGGEAEKGFEKIVEKLVAVAYLFFQS